MDEIYTDNSEYGYRMTHQELREEGFSIGKDRALKYMGILGIQALYSTKKRLSSLKHLEHKISNAMDATLATNVLQEALSIYPKPKIFNSDQGSQYTSYEHMQILKENNIEISMNGRGRSIDNIMIERFFRTLKHSNIYISDYQSIKELKEGIKQFVHKYNFKRFHSSIGYQKPMNYYLKSIEKSSIRQHRKGGNKSGGEVVLIFQAIIISL